MKIGGCQLLDCRTFLIVGDDQDVLFDLATKPPNGYFESVHFQLLNDESKNQGHIESYLNPSTKTLEVRVFNCGTMQAASGTIGDDPTAGIVHFVIMQQAMMPIRRITIQFTYEQAAIEDHAPRRDDDRSVARSKRPKLPF